jgi:hypothetical protein
VVPDRFEILHGDEEYVDEYDDGAYVDDDGWMEEPSPPRRHGRLLRLIAGFLVIAMVLAFPFGPLVDQLIQSRAYEALLAVFELVVVGGIALWLRSARRPPRGRRR